MEKDLSRLEIRYTKTLSSIVLDDYRINSVKWNDIPDGKYMLHFVNKKDILQALGVNKTISDLEAKLAEFERVAENNKKVAELVSAEHIAKIERLEQEIVEKKKEIEEYKRICTIAHVEDLQIENMLLKDKHQDKISFALEQLEQLKNNVIKEIMDTGHDCWSYFATDGSRYITREDLKFALEQEFTYQIQEFKNEQNNKEIRPKLIKKTLSITSELNKEAEDLEINFSKVLREALKKEIKQLKEGK